MKSRNRRPVAAADGAGRHRLDHTVLTSLLAPIGHSFEVSRERRRLIRSRVRMAAGALFVMTLAWIVVDACTMRWPYWGIVAAERMIAAGAFALLAFGPRALLPAGQFTAVGALVLIPIFFLLGVHSAVDGFSAIGDSVFVSTAYLYAPFLIAVSFSVFPLTALESVILSLPVLALAMLSVASRPELFASPSATLLRLGLIISVAAFASMSQLRLLIGLTEHSVRDRLTGALTRRAGELRLRSEFSRALRRKQPMTVAFIDIDNFKAVNDKFGHVAGDDVLREAAHSIDDILEQSGFLIRWGGEEFVLCMPRADLAAAHRRIEAIGAHGLGERPEGGQVTASLGFAEYSSEGIDDALTLVRVADERMYGAKAAGRNCYLDGSGASACFIRVARPSSFACAGTGARAAGRLRLVVD